MSWCERSSKGRADDSKPGTRVDGYSPHEQKKQDLEVSKKEGLDHVKEAKIKQGRMQGGGLTRNRRCYVYTPVHVYLIYVICE